MKTDLKEALRYMGVKGAPDPATLALAKQAEEEVNAHAKVRSVYKLFDVNVSEEGGFVELAKTGGRGSERPRQSALGI